MNHAMVSNNTVWNSMATMTVYALSMLIVDEGTKTAELSTWRHNDSPEDL